MLDATQDAGLGWGGCERSLHLHTCWMLRKLLGWGGGDVNVPCACTHVGCYARCWVGVGGVLTFLALAHMLDATQDAGLGWGGCERSLHLHTCWMLRKRLGWGGGDVNVPCTCTHVGCYARCWVGVGGMLTLLALAHMLDATQDAGLGWGGC